MSGDVHVRFCERLGVELPRATHLVVGFEHQEADRFLAELRERFARFGLALHPDKTRLIEFGRHADRNRRGRGDGKPETFNFLGFTHSCGKTRKGRFAVWRQTIRQRWQAKLREVRLVLRRRVHASLPEQGVYLRSVLLGHVRYYGVPRNGPSLMAFRSALGRVWRATLRRRSQTARVAWARIARLTARWLPIPPICHPYPNQRLASATQGGSRMRNVVTSGSVEGVISDGHSYSDCRVETNHDATAR